MANEFEEFGRSYTEGWGRIPLQKSGGIRTFKVLECRSRTSSLEKNKVVIEIITAKKTTKELIYDHDYVVANAEWYFPESKYVNTSNDVLRCVAFPARQYQKALSLQNCYFSSAYPFKLPDNVAKITKSSVLDAMEGYGNPYPTYSVAMNYLQSGEAIAKAFNRRWLIATHPESEYPLVVYKNTVVGFDSGNRIIIGNKDSNLEEIINKLTGKPIGYGQGPLA